MTTTDNKGVIAHPFRTVLAFINSLYAIVAFLIAIILYFDRTNNSTVEFIKTGLTFSLLPAPLWLVANLYNRQWRMSLLLLLPSGFAAAYFLLPHINQSPPLPVGAEKLAVLTFNVWWNHSDADALAQIILDADADVVLLQELGDLTANALVDALDEFYPHQALHAQSGWDAMRGQGVFSRYPLANSDYWQYDDLPLSHGHQRVELDFNGETIVLYNIHPWPPVDYGRGLSVRFTDDNERSHRIALQRLHDRAQAETLPTIVAGDFNMSEQFVEYHEMTRHFTDAYRQAGRDLGYTYPAKGLGPWPTPLIRLDYVFHSEHFVAVDARVWPDAGPSDHRPVRVELAFVGD